jgi:hypothetical protein
MKTVFIRAIEAPIDEKEAVIRAAAQGANATRFEVDQRTFAQVPRSPFAYWTSDVMRMCFALLPKFESNGRIARLGGSTKNDGRFLRLWWESLGAKWLLLAKGGSFSRFYADIYLLVNWHSDAREIEAELLAKYPYLGKSADFVLHRENPYFRSGLTWPRRTQGGLSFRAMPEGCIFADKGPAAFVDGDDPRQLLALAAIANSRAFAVLVELQMAFGSYEVGVIQLTPVPSFTVEEAAPIVGLARQAWSCKRRLDTCTENSHAFLLPALLQADAGSFVGRAQRWEQLSVTTQAQLDGLSREIDDHAYRLYGISDEERQRIELGFNAGGEPVQGKPDDDNNSDTEEAAEVEAKAMVASLLSWALGVAFGRFDVRLATGEREAPPEPEPFDPLPVCSPGMLTGDDGLPVEEPPSGYPLTFPLDGILVDDPGHTRDVVRAVRSVFEAILNDANAGWQECAELLGTPDLRSWFARDFFDPHIKRYSKSRRKAPIYWQLATPSASYSVWLYVHAFSKDTLFRVQNDYVAPKLAHEERRLETLTSELRDGSTAAQRKALAAQEAVVDELRTFLDEVKLVAPLWKPNLDDGVIINFAPLWRLVPQNKSWQKELKSAWDALCEGKHDWAHLAMHLWPGRVVPKCAKDRSLAIAHGLEDVFWVEGTDGKWSARKTPTRSVDELVRQRTSPAVKSALKSLLEAPAVAGKGVGRRGGGRRRKSSGAAEEGDA